MPSTPATQGCLATFDSLSFGTAWAGVPAGPEFHGTGDPLGHWFVSTNVDRNGDTTHPFRTDSFVQAVNLNHDPSRLDWIADVPSGSHGGVGNWTFFVFRQTFDLSGFDPVTARLTFRWAADDSGEIFADRGSWIPAFRLNGGAFVNYPGATPDNRIPTYSYCDWTTISSGFIAGLNTIDFYVEGNGMTDGFGLQVQSFQADVPAPGAIVMLLPGRFLIGTRRRTMDRGRR
jgi:hypothetical protein